MFKRGVALVYTLILCLLITSLAIPAEIRKLGEYDLSWGPYGTTWTSAGGKSVRYIPRYFDNNAYDDNLSLYGLNVYGNGTGVLTGFSIPLYLTNSLSVYDVLTTWVDVRAYLPAEYVTDGSVDYSVYVQNAIDNAYSEHKPLVIPPGTYKGSFTIKGSIMGLPGQKADTILLGLPGEDVLKGLAPGDPGFSAYYDENLVVSDLTIIVDDSIDAASASRTDAGDNTITVGNCGIAYPFAGGGGTDPGSLVRGTFRRLTVKSLSGQDSGQNNSCGMLFQRAAYGSLFEDVKVLKLKYGITEMLPVTSPTMFAYAPDFNTYIGFVAASTTWPMRLYNGLNNVLISPQIYGSTAGEKGIFVLAGASNGRTYPEGFTMYSPGIELNSNTTGEVGKYEGYEHTIFSGRLKGAYGTGYVTWGASNSMVVNTEIYNNAENVVSLVLSGSNNKFIGIRILNAGFVQDTGKNNLVEVGRIISSELMAPWHEGSKKTSVSNRINGDFILSGNQSTGYKNADDLWITPHEILWLGYTTTLTDDNTVESGEYMTIPANGDGYAASFLKKAGSNIYVGSNVPKTKARVYLKIRASDNTTQTWYISAPPASSRGSDTLTLTASWQVLGFDADFSAATVGDVVQVAAGGTSASTSVDVAWIAIRPYSDDIYSLGDLTISTAGKGAILKNAAGTVTKRVRLNDTGDGLIYEAP